MYVTQRYKEKNKKQQITCFNYSLKLFFCHFLWQNRGNKKKLTNFVS